MLLAADQDLCDGRLAMVRSRVTLLHHDLPEPPAAAFPASLREVA
jgi:hypothetical protein